MKLKIFFLGTFTTILFFIKPAEAQVSQLPASSGASCQNVINLTKTELAKKGYYITFTSRRGEKIQPRILFDDIKISDGYYNFPASRVGVITFSALKDYPPDQLMASMSARIMADCPKVGLVQYAWFFEGLKPVGYFSDNTARVFKFLVYSESGSHPHIRTIQTGNGERQLYEWGYYFSP
jgi:hypothetical protein